MSKADRIMGQTRKPEFGVDSDGNPVGFFNIGVYQDKYIKENGKWLFQLRKYAVLYNDNGTGNMTGTANPYPELIK